MKTAGMALENDALRVQLQLDNTQLMLQELDNNTAIATYNLGLMLNKDLTATAIDTNAIFAPKDVTALANYLNNGMATRTELKAQELRTQVATNNVKITKGAYMPTVSVGANYLYANPNARYIPNTTEFKSTWDAGINASFDLTNLLTNKHNITEATANLAIAKLGSEQIADGIKMEINQAYFNYQTAANKIPTQKQIKWNYEQIGSASNFTL